MKIDVLQFDKLINFYDGRFVKEKTYHGEVNGILIGSTMWCAWLDKRQRWSKWHVRQFFVGEDKIYTDPNEFNTAVENRTLSILR